MEVPEVGHQVEHTYAGVRWPLGANPFEGTGRAHVCGGKVEDIPLRVAFHQVEPTYAGVRWDFRVPFRTSAGRAHVCGGKVEASMPAAVSAMNLRNGKTFEAWMAEVKRAAPDLAASVKRLYPHWESSNPPSWAIHCLRKQGVGL